MKNLLTGIAIGLSLGIAGIAVAAGTVLPQMDAAKQLILKDNAELHSRLNEPMLWDTSVASSQDISQAYVDVANSLGVTSADIISTGNNVQTAIQVKLQKLNKMCRQL